MRKKYYVDVENIAYGWMSTYKELDEDDQIILFTSSKTNLPYSVLRELLDINKTNQITILEAFVRGCGDSALDYFLMGTLKNDAYYDKDSEYIIISNDHDFDDFVVDMSNNDYHISRLSFGKTAETEPILSKPGKGTVETIGELRNKIISIIVNSPVINETTLPRLEKYNLNHIADCFIQHPGSFNEVSKSLLASLGKKKHAQLLGLIPKDTRTVIINLVQSYQLKKAV